MTIPAPPQKISPSEGRSAASKSYDSTRQFIDEVLGPFGARFMTLRGGKVVTGTAFYDSIAFNELWATVNPGG